MDPFKRIPAELIYVIIQNVPDFIGLHSLFLVSETVKAVLQSEPSVILIDDLVVLNLIAIMPDIRKNI